MSNATDRHRPAPSFGLADPTLLLRRGFEFWETMRRRSGSEIVQTRLLHERITAIRGPEAAQFFYEEAHTERANALPTALVSPLFGKGPVHILDGPAHAHRKAMFNGLLDVEASQQIAAGIERRWDERAPQWSGRINVVDEVGQMLLEAGTEWIGIPVPDQEIADRTRDMLAMVDGFGAPTGRQLRARRARRRTDSWLTGLVEDSRRSPGGSSPLDIVVYHRDENGDLLPAHTAAVEVINLLRPLVAVTWLVSGLFDAFGMNPERRAELLDSQVSEMDVAQEIRRTYPFVPFLGTRATEELTWHDAVIPRGTLIVLDVWGTNHDPRIWREPDSFDPHRFKVTPVTPYNLIPQGGGFRETGHRCPGEDLTLAVLTTLVRRVAGLRFTAVGPRPGLRRMPPKPKYVVAIRH